MKKYPHNSNSDTYSNKRTYPIHKKNYKKNKKK